MIKKVVIAGHPIKVKMVDEPEFHSKDRNERLLGLTYYSRSTIYIRKGITRSLKKDTLIHEILHFVWFFASADHVTDPNEEYLVGVMSTGLNEVFTHNPKLVRYLSK